MIRTHVLLSKATERKLRTLSLRTGKDRRDLIRQAVEHLVASTHNGDRLRYLHKGKGLWRKRTDLPDFSRLRSEWERF